MQLYDTNVRCPPLTPVSAGVGADFRMTAADRNREVTVQPEQTAIAEQQTSVDKALAAATGRKVPLDLPTKIASNPRLQPLTQLCCTVGAELAIRLSGSVLVPTAARLAVLKV